MLAVLKTARAWRARLFAVLAFLLVVIGIAALGRSGLFAADPVSTLARREVFLPAVLALPTPLPVPDLGSQSLHGELVSRGYTLDGVRTAEVDVPRMFAARLPPDLPDLDIIDLRKQVFVKLMLPLILA